MVHGSVVIGLIRKEQGGRNRYNLLSHENYNSPMIERLALHAVQLKRRRGSHTGALMNGSEDLIARARAGDHEAFRLVFERYSRPVLAFIYEMVSQRDIAEELTQETFVRAYHNLKHLRDDTKFSTWLFGIGRNVARESLRSRQRENQHCTHDIDSVPPQEHAGTIDSPMDQLLGKELNVAMEIALQALDEEKRIVFFLKVLQQRSYQEITEITGFSLAKVKTELHRARLEMRRRLQLYLEVK
jgi:RNA polymerase sigma-70 factor, ECF subfamily